MAKKKRVSASQHFLETNFDEIMLDVGVMGKYTIAVLLIMSIAITFGAMNITASVFLAADMAHTCVINDDLVDNISQKCDLNLTASQFVLENKEKPQCFRYTTSSILNANCSQWENRSIPASGNMKTQKCDHWSYDTTTYEATMVSDFDLVCGEGWKAHVSQLILMFGVMAGALFGGMGSDRWGRKTFFTINIVILFCSAFLSSFVKSLWAFYVVRMFVGFGAIGLCVSGYVYAMELISDKHRVLLGQLIQCTFSVGFMVLALFAYLQRYWIYLNFIISVPILTILPLYMWVSAESPRWQLSKSNSVGAYESLKKMARINKKMLEKIVEQITTNTSPILKKSAVINESTDADIEVTFKLTTCDIFRNPVMLKITLVLLFNWFTVVCIYYGLTLSTSYLDGNPFLNFFLVALVEVPANIGSIWFIAIWGRRPTISLSNIICGLSLISLLFVPEGYPAVNVILFLVGKFGVTATFSCIYLYSSELYPTQLRGNGIGICSSVSRLGGILSPLILMTADLNKSLPHIMFGAIAIIGGLLILLLPETKGTSLPDSVEEVTKLYQHRKITVGQQCVPKCT